MSGKGHLLPVMRRSPNTSTHCILVLESPRKAMVKHWTEHHFTPQRRRRARSAPVVGASPAWPTGSSKHPTRGSCLHSRVLQEKDSISSPRETDVILGLVRCHVTHMFKQDKGVHIGSETGKVLLTQSDKSSTSHGDSLSLGKEVFQAQGPSLCG